MRLRSTLWAFLCQTETNRGTYHYYSANLLIALGSLLHLAQLQFRHARFRTGHADFRTACGNASTLPRSAGGNHFETLRKLPGM